MKNREVKKRICVLEDDEGIRDMIFLILSDENYEVESFQNIEEFNRRGQSLFTDLFLLDVMLPDGNGIDVCASLKTAHHTRYIPVLMMSANYNELEIRSSCEIKGFVAKPFEIDSFLYQIDEAIKS